MYISKMLYNVINIMKNNQVVKSQMFSQELQHR